MITKNFFKTSAKVFIFTALIMLSYNCSNQKNNECSIESIEQAFENGNFNEAQKQSQKIKDVCQLTTAQVRKLDSIDNWIYRIENDFTLSNSEVKEKLASYIPNVSESMITNWEKSGKLEMTMINGEKRYFKRSVSNLFLLDSVVASYRYSEGLINSELIQFRLAHSKKIIEANSPIIKKFRCNYTITLDADVVPEDKLVRCWLPFPSNQSDRQTNIKLHSANDSVYTISKNSDHHSVFMEKKAKEGEPLVFNIVFSFDATSQFVSSEMLSKTNGNYPADILNYTKENLPHIHFTDEIQHLTDSLTKGLQLPYEKVKSIYYWINKEIPWAGALEYGTMKQIPSYVLKYRHGDCGMQTLLFMSMARYAGIPVRWQSGWMLHPNEVNLHDWCEVYYNGVGWVPLDQSFNLQPSELTTVKEFYITGIDSYRLIVNDGFSDEFDPVKTHWRSEPIDFQRGELEWDGGNIYFDKWDYHMEVEYLNG